MKLFDISGFPAAHLEIVWNEVEPLVANALEYSAGEYYPEDIFRYIKSGEMQLWISSEETTLKGVVVTELLPFPRALICQIVLSAGESLDQWVHCFDAIEVWAIEKGADYIRSLARAGWKPRAKARGYEMQYCMFSKSLRTGHENTH